MRLWTVGPQGAAVGAAGLGAALGAAAGAGFDPLVFLFSGIGAAAGGWWARRHGAGAMPAMTGGMLGGGLGGLLGGPLPAPWLTRGPMAREMAAMAGMLGGRPGEPRGSQLIES